MARSISPGRVAHWPWFRVRSSSGPDRRARPTTLSPGMDIPLPPPAARVTLVSGYGPAAWVTPAARRVAAKLRRADPGRVDGHRQVRAVLRGHRVVEQLVGAGQQRHADQGGRGGRGQHHEHHHGRHQAAGDPAGGRPEHRGAVHERAPAAAGGEVTASLVIRPFDQPDHPARVARGQLRAVRDQDQRLPAAVQLEQQPADGLAGGAVQRPGRLVGQQHGRRVDQRPGDGHPLPLPAGQPPGIGVPVLRDAQLVQQPGHRGPGLAARRAGQLGGQQHVVRHGQVVQQVEELEDHPDPAAAEPGQAGFAQRVHPLAGHGDRAAGRLVQPGDQVQQRGLAAARRAHHGDRLAVPDVQAQLGQGRLAARVTLGHLADRDQGIHHSHETQPDPRAAGARWGGLHIHGRPRPTSSGSKGA